MEKGAHAQARPKLKLVQGRLRFVRSSEPELEKCTKNDMEQLAAAEMRVRMQYEVAMRKEAERYEQAAGIRFSDAKRQAEEAEFRRHDAELKLAEADTKMKLNESEDTLRTWRTR